MTPPASDAVYHVELDIYEGPLDLLLHLIERQELDISRVSLALVADQYLEYLGNLAEITSENLADFLVIAAKLLVIKSKSLLPAPITAPDETAEDVGEQMARQLAEYKRYKLAADKLRELEQRGWHTYLRLAPPPKPRSNTLSGALQPSELAAALVKAVSAQTPLDSVDTIVQPVQVYISDCIHKIRQLLVQQNRLPFRQALDTAHSRLEVIVLFLALLELIKQQQIQVKQENPFGEIMLERRSKEPDTPLTDLEYYGEDEPV